MLATADSSPSSKDIVEELVQHQLAHFFPGPEAAPERVVLDVAYNQAETCVTSLKEWSSNGFQPLVSWQYATYLYYLSRAAYLSSGRKDLATKLFLINKALNSLELYYEIDLPAQFFLSHTVGLVFGKADYEERCVFHQGCTIGRSGNDRPRLGRGIVMFPNSSIIGRCIVRANTVLSPGVQLVNCDTPGNCIAFSGRSGRPIFKEIAETFSNRYFGSED